MANVKMGFEGIAYYGAAGSSATNQLLNVRDIKLELDVDKGNTTVRGDSSGPPIETEDVCIRKVSVELTMINDITDTFFAALMTAAAAGSGVALKLKSYSSGRGPDADFSLKASLPWNLNGEQVITFTATPSRSYGRAPSNWTT